jgi:hypothetical protein
MILTIKTSSSTTQTQGEARRLHQYSTLTITLVLVENASNPDRDDAAPAVLTRRASHRWRRTALPRARKAGVPRGTLLTVRGRWDRTLG